MNALALAVLLARPAAAAPRSFASGPDRARLVELYSSEGCSSCPPADEWLDGLRAHARLWRDFVPLAFHVTYWDSIGWPDPFGDPSFDARQRAYAASWGTRSVYTPGLVLDGAEWRGWGGEPPAAGAPAGTLRATLDGDAVSARFEPAAGGGAYELYAARLGFGLVSVVTAGENAGRTLRHDFVVRGLARAPMSRRGGAWTAVLRWPRGAGPRPEREALAVWVVGSDGRPVQAAGGFLAPASVGR